MAVVLTSVTGGPFGDDGGWEAVAVGTFPTDEGVRFRVSLGALDYPCYSGIPGQSDVCYSLDGTTCGFIVPALPTGSWTLTATNEAESQTDDLAAAVVVVKGSYTTNLYALRGIHGDPRDVGPHSIADEE